MLTFLEVEHKIQLAHVPEIPVENLDVAVDDLERDELVVAIGDARNKEERGVATIGDLVTCGPKKGREIGQ
jgi:hypothetical protein